MRNKKLSLIEIVKNLVNNNILIVEQSGIKNFWKQDMSLLKRISKFDLANIKGVTREMLDEINSSFNNLKRTIDVFLTEMDKKFIDSKKVIDTGMEIKEKIQKYVKFKEKYQNLPYTGTLIELGSNIDKYIKNFKNFEKLSKKYSNFTKLDQFLDEIDSIRGSESLQLRYLSTEQKFDFLFDILYDKKEKKLIQDYLSDFIVSYFNFKMAKEEPEEFGKGKTLFEDVDEVFNYVFNEQSGNFKYFEDIKDYNYKSNTIQKKGWKSSEDVMIGDVKDGGEQKNVGKTTKTDLDINNEYEKVKKEFENLSDPEIQERMLRALEDTKNVVTNNIKLWKFIGLLGLLGTFVGGVIYFISSNLGKAASLKLIMDCTGDTFESWWNEHKMELVEEELKKIEKIIKEKGEGADYVGEEILKFRYCPKFLIDKYGEKIPDEFKEVIKKYTNLKPLFNTAFIDVINKLIERSKCSGETVLNCKCGEDDDIKNHIKSEKDNIKQHITENIDKYLGDLETKLDALSKSIGFDFNLLKNKRKNVEDFIIKLVENKINEDEGGYVIINPELRDILYNEDKLKELQNNVNNFYGEEVDFIGKYGFNLTKFIIYTCEVDRNKKINKELKKEIYEKIKKVVEINEDEKTKERLRKEIDAYEDIIDLFEKFQDIIVVTCEETTVGINKVKYTPNDEDLCGKNTSEFIEHLKYIKQFYENSFHNLVNISKNNKSNKTKTEKRTFKEYIQYQIKDGYFEKVKNPLRCQIENSKELKVIYTNKEGRHGLPYPDQDDISGGYSDEGFELMYNKIKSICDKTDEENTTETKLYEEIERIKSLFGDNNLYGNNIL